MANGLQQSEVDAGEAYENEEARRISEQHRTERERHKQMLNLQRESVLSQKTSNPARRAALEAALVQIEAQIEALH